MSQKYTKYNLEYDGVLCTAVDWENYEFIFQFRNKEYHYSQTGYISCSADTDHIRCVIEEFKNYLMQKVFEENCR